MKGFAKGIATAILLAGALSAGQAKALDDVTISNIGHGYWAAPLYVAQHNHLFKKHGLNAHVTTVKGGSLALQSVLTNSVDITQVTFEHVLKAAVHGQRVVSIYRFGQIPTTNVVASNKILDRAKGGSLDARVQALKGARVGLPSAGGSNEKMLEMLAEVHGLDINSVERLYLGGNPGNYVAAFKAHQIDAALFAEPVGLLVKRAGLGGTLVNVMAGEEPRFKDLLFLTLTSNPETIAKKPQILKRVTEAYDEALKIMHEDPENAIKVMGEEFPRLSPQDNREIYMAMLPTWTRNGKMTMDEAKRTMSYMEKLGDLDASAKFDPSTLFTNDLQDK